MHGGNSQPSLSLFTQILMISNYTPQINAEVGVASSLGILSLSSSLTPSETEPKSSQVVSRLL